MFRKIIFPTIIICLLIVLAFFPACNKSNESSSKNINTLDSLMQKSEEFSMRQLTNIAELKHKRKNAKSPADKYLFDNRIHEVYSILNADSALKYADQSILSAQEAGNKEWETTGIINKSSILAATGLLMEAMNVINTVDRENLKGDQLVDYYGHMIYLYSHLGNFVGDPNNEYYVTERLYKDSIMEIITPAHPDFLWYKGWDILGTDQKPDSLIRALKDVVENSGFDDRRDAKNAYILARLYEQKGDRKNYINYLALSAIIDVKIANAEISSLEDLAKAIFDNGKGDVNRAYAYITYSLNKTLTYPNRNKAFGISQNLDKISSEYQKRLEKQQKRTITFLILFCALVVILIVAIIEIILKNKKLTRQRKDLDATNDTLNQKVEQLSTAESQLHEMNKLLKQLNSDLKEKNEELYEANFVKEEYIGYVFNLCSSYIAKIEDLKRNIYVKLIKKQYKDIEKETSDIDMKEELKEFYHSFDTIFLNLYPNFVGDFNTLLKPDKQITVKEGELLNMDLRIYALVRLGISDSVKIADFLHCSPQTVYNYRFKTRNKALIPKEEFPEAVKNLGKVRFT